ncbi:hypothetical protein AB0N79_37050 [Streptomyces microflavus]|uniref:hypothetical protein n=1 Tax=Streptomyces microflavus TaxID=1919 RepID=UPI00342CF552
MRNWGDHLALWSQTREPGARPLDACVVDLRAPELDDPYVNREGLARIAGISTEDLPDPKHSDRSDLPEPQHEVNGEMWWAKPVAQDWAESHRQTHVPESVLSATTSYGTTQPVGLVDDHDRLRRTFHETLTADRGTGRRTTPYLKGEPAREAADSLAWDAAASVIYGNDQGLVPHEAIRVVLIESIVARFAEDVDRGKEEQSRLAPIRANTMRLLAWYLRHRPRSTAGILGEICLLARVKLDLSPSTVGSVLRRSFHLSSGLDRSVTDALLESALPPSARPVTG